MAWLVLGGAIVAEVLGTLALRMGAVSGRLPWYATSIIGYAFAFTFLFGALQLGMPLGVAYGIWVAVGVALTAIASRILFNEPLTPVMIGGISLVATGVLLVELGA